MTPTSGSRWSSTLDEHRSAQRDHILDAALDLLSERGVAGVTMSALAERAAVSRPTLYRYFPDIDAVLLAWVSREIDRSVAVLVERAVAVDDPVARLELLISEQLATFASQDHRLSAEHFDSEAASPALRRAVEAGMAPLRRLLTETIAAGVTCSALTVGCEPPVAADLLLGLLGASRRLLVAGQADPPAVEHAITQLLRRGWVLPPDPPG